VPVIVARRVRRGDPGPGAGDAYVSELALLADVTGISRFRLLELPAMPPRRLQPKALSRSLQAGAAYDAVFALLLVAFPGWISETFRLPLPGERFYLWLIAVFLVSLAGFYVLIARDPRQHRDFVRLAVAIRLLGAAVIAAAALGRPDLASLYAIAFADLAFGLAHLAFSPSLAPQATPAAPPAPATDTPPAS
jgi:hypothetical protein